MGCRSGAYAGMTWAWLSCALNGCANLSLRNTLLAFGKKRMHEEKFFSWSFVLLTPRHHASTSLTTLP